MWMHGWRHQRRRGLRTWIIMMIQRSPRNGAEIMAEIETMTQGWWRPSPGSVYPVLDDLTKEGLINKREDGRYELTSRGKESIEWPFGMPNRQPQGVEEMLNEITGYVSYFEDLNKSDRTRIEPHKDRLKRIAERLSDLTR
jgi:DNA-binding PadR family transcriptional regulator